MPALGFSLLLLIIFAPSQPTQGEELRPPQNITFVSEDYNLFVKWLPPNGSPPGVSYTVLWIDTFSPQWDEVQHCRNIAETICNITCVFQEPSNRYRFKVEAQSGIGAGSVPSAPESIDYILQVKLAPPVLRAKNTRNILTVNVSFTYPSCMKDVFQDLTYDLETWQGEVQKLPLEDLDEPSVEFNTTDWLHGEYCLRARTSFRNVDRNWSNFSEPLCLWLHEEGAGVKVKNWEIIAGSLIATSIFAIIGVTMLLTYCRCTSKQVEMPSALNFSKYQHPKNVLELGEIKLTKMNVCFILEIIPARLPLSADSSLKESEESDDEDDSSSRVPYTATLRFQRDENCSTVGTFPTFYGSSSGSRDSQQSGENWPAAKISEPLFTAEWMTTGASSGLFEKTSLSEDSVMDESVSFADDFSSAPREGQEIPNRDLDFLNQLMFSGSHNLHCPRGLEIRTAGVQCRSICASLQNSQASLCSEPEGQAVEEWRCENDSSNGEALQLERSMLGVSCIDRVENGEQVESNTRKSTGHNYQPRQGHYISRT
ncbi:interferon lambda receptor 1 [Erythrolamprus reginae]|uniref:interferon lambda receptor 1 n=1 Tax=Erythrolamprus reginae TaxID=121349 RepID=UPI00396C6295